MEMRRAFDQGKYEVRLQGHLDVRWSDWLGGMEVEHLDDGTTRLVGELADQASLHGVLGMVRDLGALILSVSRMGDESHDMRDPERRVPGPQRNSENTGRTGPGQSNKQGETTWKRTLQLR